jgi:hypothetical protein
LLKARRARHGAALTCSPKHGNDINWRQNRVAHLGAYQPSAIGQALHGVQRQKVHGLNIGLAGSALVVQRSASRIQILRYYPATDSRYGRHLMWDELKDVFTGPIGPWIGLLGLVVISLLWLEGERLLYTPIAFAWATLIVARHFDFVVLDQYMLIVAVYFGVYYAMPHWEILKPPSTDALKKEP